MSMKSFVVMKSYQNGISLYLDAEAPFDQVLAEIETKFRESSNFFRDAKMALSIEGRTVNDSEEMQILKAIQSNSRVNIVCLVGKDEEMNQQFMKSVQQYEAFCSENEGQFYRGTLKNRQVLETDSSIVVIGDVFPGSAVISTRDIIILGALYGEAYAGGNGDHEHFVVALEMTPERLKIGDFKYKTNEKQSRWGFKPKVQPKIAFVKNEKVVIEPITKDLLGGLI